MDKINFIFDNMPDLYNKEEESNLYKILKPIAEQLDGLVSDIEEVKKSKFIDNAKGRDLDKIASLLNMYRFNNENDELFRSRIKSKVPSFIGGGAISAIKQVVNNYLGVEPIIIEHYKDGEGHLYFDNGILNGFNLSVNNGLISTVNDGVAYIKGNKITVDNKDLTIQANSVSYIKLDNNAQFIIDSIETINDSQILLARIQTNANSITQITDMRNILNPEEHYITNTASITVQIPFNFTLSNISLDNVKDILRNTKAAGIALLIKIMDTYNDAITINDSMHSFFLMGFSGIGGNNVLGGK